MDDSASPIKTGTHLDALAEDNPAKGGQTCKKNPLYVVVPPSCHPASSSLAGQTIDALRRYFDDRGHYPSDEMWTALQAVAKTMESMAEGRCRPAIHISSLDPGVGKTTTVVHFLRALLASKVHDGVGAVVCVRRKEQIEAVVKEAGLAHADYAVLTADAELNALGCGSPREARVLFTTHAMIEKRCSGRRFAAVADFHYHGKPRTVRIWDEAILPGQTLTLRRDDLAGLLAPLRGRHPALAEAIEDLFSDLKSADDGAVVCLPDLAEDHGLDLNQALSLVSGRPELVPAIEALWFLFGRHVTVRREGVYGQTMLDYRDTLPNDIAPLLALDASARVRTVYDCWKEGRGGLVMLPDAPKRYDDLAIHVWQHGGGKSAFKNDGKELVEGIASAIMTRPDEEWLVVHHKAAGGMDFEAELRARLGMFGPTVHYLHWGAHDATNAFGHVPNVVLAGTLFYRPSYYEALGRLASAYPSQRGRYDAERTKQVTLGEHRHLILQALCRGAVRKCVGASCPPARAYIIASAKSGIADTLPAIFPGAQVHPWRPVQKPLSGRVADAFQFIVGELARAPWSLVTFPQVMKHLGWKDRKDFKRSIRHHPDFIDALAAAGIEEWGSGQYPRGFQRISPPATGLR
jgi:hypothetical protein